MIKNILSIFIIISLSIVLKCGRGVMYETDDNGEDCIDRDGDGFFKEGCSRGVADCDDGDSSIFPGTDEIPYNGVDEDCDGFDLTDIDGDGYIGMEAGEDDCNDEDPKTYPGADEIPYDGLDQDCDGEDLTDKDGDGYEAKVAGGDDCDDDNSIIYPGADDIPNDEIDQNCDGIDLAIWANIYTEGSWFQFYAVKEISTGGYIALGQSRSDYTSDADIWLIKLDIYGDEIWRNMYSGENGCSIFGSEIIERDDGGYVVGGYISCGGDDDLLLLTIDQDGDVLFSRTYGEEDYSEFGGYIHQTDDGGYIIGGSQRSISNSDYDIILLKINSSGDEEWREIIGTEDFHEWIGRVRQTDDGGYICVGGISKIAYSQLLVIKTDESGSVEWSRGWDDDLYGGVYHSVEQTSNGGYIISGTYCELECDFVSEGMILLKLDSAGEEEWVQIFGADAGYGYGYHSEETSDGGFIVIGERWDVDEIWAIKTDIIGDIEWEMTYSDGNQSGGYWITQTRDGGYIMAGYHVVVGYTTYQGILVKTDPEGNY